MDGEETFDLPIDDSLMPIFFSLSVSIGYLLRFGASSDKTPNNILLFMVMLTLYLGILLLLLRLTVDSNRSLNPTSSRLTDHLARATLMASFTVLVLALPEISTAFTNSTLFSHWVFTWAWHWGVILLSVAVVYKSINEIPVSRSQQYTKVAFFTLCVALTGLYTEPHGSMPCTITCNSVIYRTFCIHHFALVPCSFFLGALLLIIGALAPDSSACPFISVTFKEAFANLTLSVGCITLLIGASLTVCVSIINSAMVGGAGGAGDAMEVGTM